MKRTNVDPAFPVPYDSELQGITIRDYFAAMAMQAIITIRPNTFREGEGFGSDVAMDAYFMADAMMVERETRDE